MKKAPPLPFQKLLKRKTRKRLLPRFCVLLFYDLGVARQRTVLCLPPRVILIREPRKTLRFSEDPGAERFSPPTSHPDPRTPKNLTVFRGPRCGAKRNRRIPLSRGMNKDRTGTSPHPSRSVTPSPQRGRLGFVLIQWLPLEGKLAAQQTDEVSEKQKTNKKGSRTAVFFLPPSSFPLSVILSGAKRNRRIPLSRGIIRWSNGILRLRGKAADAQNDAGARGLSRQRTVPCLTDAMKKRGSDCFRVFAFYSFTISASGAFFFTLSMPFRQDAFAL